MPIDQSVIDRTLSTPQGEQGYKLCEALLDAGFQAWWVGGCTRDMLLGKIPEDIDISTNALPNEVRNVFKKTDDTSAALGSVLVSLAGNVFEVTTFREDDMASDGRQPESVVFSTKEKDAHRRDFTVNAIYWNPISSEVYDPYEGEKDLNELLIRFIGDPQQRIDHDVLRMLRAVRFRALLSGQYHPETFKALHSHAKKIATLSGTRVFLELEKMLFGPNPAKAFEDLWETDILEYLIPELHACKGVAQPSPPHSEGDVWDHTLKAIDSFTEDHSADTRWATLLHDIGKPATFSIEQDRIHFNNHASTGANIAHKVLERLQCTKKRAEKICWIVEHHMMMGSFEQLTDERKSHWYYHPWFIELLQVFWLDIKGTGREGYDLYDFIIADYNAFLDSHPRPPRPLLSGNEVMEILGIQPGEEVGKILAELYKAQIEKKIQSKKEAKALLSAISADILQKEGKLSES